MFARQTQRQTPTSPAGPRASEASVKTLGGIGEDDLPISSVISSPAPAASAPQSPMVVGSRPTSHVPYAFPRIPYDPLSFAIAFTQGLFRHRTVRTVELTAWGNFVVDIPVPEKVKAKCPFDVGEGKEFSHLRYSAVTGDPNEFCHRGFSLRAAELKRNTELFIVITMYNERENLFIKTWKAVVKNISYLCSLKDPKKKWGIDSWKKVAVCIVADGREKINPRTLIVLGLMGVYQEGLIKTSVNSELVTAHVFEYTTTIMVDNENSIRDGLIPVQVIFCLKEKNAKKINSHRWFFNAFSKSLKPNVCVLLDVGTKPSDKSIYKLWKAFDKNLNVAGACGEIYVDTGFCGSKLFNPLVGAQNFEYKISNILDKPLESCWGFISVLPGAFSAYRYSALQNGADGRGPLEKYFIGETQHSGQNVTKANMYLAEDRILCFELVSKRGEAWLLKYVRKARAETDVPDTIAEFISQRRRWLNGSFFASVHALANFHQIIFRSRHTFLRKLGFTLQAVYNFVNLLFSWFALGNFYVAFYFICSNATRDPDSDPFLGYGPIVFIALREFYLLAIVLVFVSSLGNRPQGSKTLYLFCFLLFSLMMATLLYVVGCNLYFTLPRNLVEWNKVHLMGKDFAIIILFLSMGSTYGIYLFSSLLFLDTSHMITSFIPYLLIMPSFINVLMIYSFCNIHDVSWGTKGETKAISDVAPIHTKSTSSGNPVVTTDLPENQSDIDSLYESFYKTLVNKPKKEAAAAPDARQLQEDFFKLFRTRVVLLWMGCNALLIFGLTTPTISSILQISADGESNPYLIFLFWSVGVTSFIRFVGCIIFRCFGG